MTLGKKIQKWQTLSAEVVFKADHWFRVIQDKVQLPNGRIVDDYFRIEAPEYVLIYALANDGKVLVERQYKHGLGKNTLTFPAGFIDRDESPLLAAKRELLEETGFSAETWKCIGTYVLDGTRGSGKAHYFYAENLNRVAEPEERDMEELEISFMSVEELVDSIAHGDMCLLPAISIMSMATNPLFERLLNIAEEIK